MERFSLEGQVFVITGGAGLMGRQHALAIAEAGGIPVILDIEAGPAESVASEVKKVTGVSCLVVMSDITNESLLKDSLKEILTNYGRLDGLINNAANNEKMETGGEIAQTSIETFPQEQWENDIRVGLTGAFLCSRVFGTFMAKNQQGVVVNISSDLGLIAPDQRIYKSSKNIDGDQVFKPVSYSVVKHGVIGLTRYLAIYWADSGLRVNALCPGGIFSGQPKGLVDELTDRIPMQRMASEDEYRGAIQFLCSAASSYMNGACLVIDGGRTVW
jgi:NAD(P)-dependent dehydrogenase (short-subunit alcohol dehydrogenase family)